MNNVIIGKLRRESLELLRKHGLTPFRNIVTPKDVRKVQSETLNKNRRARAMIPETVFWLMSFCAFCKSFADALQRLWSQVALEFDEYAANVSGPTTQAFTQARGNLPIRFFRGIWNLVVEKFSARFSESMMMFKGFLLLAVDGTKVDLPPEDELLRQFGGPNNRKKLRMPQATILGLVNVLTGFCLDFIVRPYGSSENRLLRFLLKRLPRWARLLNPLLLLDSAYFGHLNLLWLMKEKMHFLMRAQKKVKYKIIERLGRGDFIVELATSPRVLKQRDYLPKIYKVRLIRYQIPGFRPALLITNLGPEEFTGEELVRLYHERWRIETFYREIKHTLEVANLRSKRVEGIYKEIHAQLTVNNLIRYIMTEAVEGTGEATVRFSFERSYRLVHEAISKMADNIGFSARRLLRIYKAVLCEIRRYRIDWRPGRRYPRKDKRHRCAKVCGGVLKVEDDVIFYEVRGAAA